MKKFTGGKILQKIVIAFITIVLLFQFMMPIRSEAASLMDMEMPEMPDVFRYMAQIVAGFGDMLMSMFNNAMLGTSGYGTAMISHEALDNTNSWFVNKEVEDSYKEYDSEFDSNSNVIITQEKKKDSDDNGQNIIIYVKNDTMEKNIIGDSDVWEVPNMLYCPENIFGNNIAMLDVNFLNPNEYTSVDENSARANEHAKSIADDKYEGEGENKKVVSMGLKTTIKNWYRTLRNLAIVALLSILVYLGIRILISSTAEDKAKHKEILKDWFIALILVFIMHFIMSAIITTVNLVNTIFNNVNDSVFINYGGTIFKTNFTGAIRFLAQSTTFSQAWVYTVIYLVLICYTFIFTIQYLKRVLYIAFYTMIAPLVAITYPLDKLGDGKSQAFNKWFKEYAMTMALQPIHLIIYTMVVSTSLNLAINNPIFALVAIGFLIPAEQFIRGLFGVESKADAGFGSFASGALTMQALNSLRKPRFGGANGKGSKGSSSGEGDTEDTKVRQVNNKELDHFKNRSRNNNQEPVNEQDEHPPVIGGGNAGQENNAWNNDNLEPEYNFDNNPWQNQNANTYQQDNEQDAVFDINNSNNNRFNQEQNNNNENEEEPQQDRIDMNDQHAGNNANDISPEEKYKNIRLARRDQFARKVGITGVKALGKAAKFTAKTGAKTALRVAGAATLGTVGLAAGIASGKGISGAWKGAAAGVTAGVAAGTSVSNLAGRAVGGTIKGAKALDGTVQKYQANKVKDLKNAGLEDRAKAYQESINSSPVNSLKDYSKYNKIATEYAVKNGKKLSWNERKELRKRIADYDTNYGVTEKDDILKGLEMEEKYRDKFYDSEDTHKSVAEIMQLKNKYGSEYASNKSKIEEFDNNLTNRGIQGSDKELIKEMFYDSHGVKYTRGITGNTANAGNNRNNRNNGNNGNAGQQ